MHATTSRSGLFAEENRIMREQLRNVVALSAVGGLLSILGCSRSAETSKTSFNEESRPPAVRYVKVAQQEVPESLDLAAKVQPDPTKVVRIFPPASGRVTAIAVKPGDQVRRGQVLAILSSSDVASAQSDYTKANAEAERTARAMERQKVLLEHGAAAEKDFLDARAQAEEARAELARAKQRLELLNINPSDTTDRVTLTSPATGVVTDVNAAPGEFSKSLESANPLVTIADLNTVWMVGDVYEKDVAKVSLGKPVTVTLQAFPDEQWSGHIDSLPGMLDPTTRTLKVRVTLPNPTQSLKPEMFGAIRVKTGTHNALVVPETAIIREGGATKVFINKEGKPERRKVTVGTTVDGKVEVLSGLQADEEVAAEGAELLKGGSSQ
jgi:cobalt-zinc-cadmium efflux system membrane fusion protein